MNHLTRLLDLLPGPYAVADDAVLTSLLDVAALELETFQEDLDRMRQSHWIRFAYRLADAEKLAALVGIQRLPWEGLEMFRERVLAVVVARLAGALGPREIKRFVFDYLRKSEDVLGCTFVPGLQTLDLEQAFATESDPPRRRALALRENPRRERASAALRARAGRVPYLHRWSETNRGLEESVATFRLSGLAQGRTSVPVLANLTTGDLLGYADRIPFGRTLVVRAGDGAGRPARATVDGADVTGRLFSLEGLTPGVPFTPAQLDAAPRLPRLARGDNEWIFLCLGLHDVRGLDHFAFALAGRDLYEAAFDRTAFDQALFPSGPVATLEMDWIETTPACFEVHVPRWMVSEPADLAAASTPRPHEQVAEGLVDTIRQLHAAGVRAEVHFRPFTERQPQHVTVRLPWKILDPETAPTGAAELTLGGRFGESPLGGARYE
ncbi:MAG TPA: hypothetical protein VGD07_17205 [Methylomirabilota bacterium]